MASLYPAKSIGNNTLGRIRPGYRACFLLIRDEDSVEVTRAWCDGELVVDKQAADVAAVQFAQ